MNFYLVTKIFCPGQIFFCPGQKFFVLDKKYFVHAEGRGINCLFFETLILISLSDIWIKFRPSSTYYGNSGYKILISLWLRQRNIKLMPRPSAWTKYFLSGTKNFCPGQKKFCPGQKNFVQDKKFWTWPKLNSHK